jgi:5,10-methylenetetrahydromethanopterin reductase
VKQLRESVTSLRGLLRGDWDSIPGVHSKMAIGGRRVPVVLAAVGPKTLRLAGEVADGVILSGGLVKASLDRAWALVEEGARSAGRNPADVTMWLNLPTCIRPTREEALRWSGPLLAMRLEEPEWLAESGIDTRGVQLSEAFLNLYPDPMHAEDPELAMALASELPEELRQQIAQASGLIGSPEDVVRGIRQAHDWGYEHIFMRTVDTMSFPSAEVEAYGAGIGDAVRAM